jgi:hypothetical protein
MAIAELTPEFEAVADQLIERTKGQVDPEVVRRLVAETVTEFADTRVREYVDVMVLHEASDKLRRLID